MKNSSISFQKCAEPNEHLKYIISINSIFLFTKLTLAIHFLYPTAFAVGYYRSVPKSSRYLYVCVCVCDLSVTA